MTKQQPCHSELSVSSKTTKQIDVTFKIDVLELIPLKFLLLLLIRVCVYLVKSEIRSSRILFFGRYGRFQFPYVYALSRAYSLQDDVVQRISKYAKMHTFWGESSSLIMM